MYTNLTFKIDRSFGDLNSFIKEKIIFIYPIKPFIDMEYQYLGYYDKIDCECTFETEEADLILTISNFKNEIRKEDLYKDILKNINYYKLELLD